MFSGNTLIKRGRHFDYWNQRMPWSWTVLLPNDTYKTYYVHYSCFTFNVVTYLPILPRNIILCARMSSK
jgi:hypothetical protein